METVEGHQIPYEYYRSESRFSTTCLKELPVLDLDQAITDSYGSLFRMEDREGRKLVMVEESSDLQDVNAVKRAFTHEELQYKAELEARAHPSTPELDWMVVDRFRDGLQIDIPAPPVATTIGEGSDPGQDFDGNPYADVESRPSVMAQAEREQESDDDTSDEGNFSDEPVDLADYL